MPARTVTLDGPLDLARTLGPLSRGPGDRTIQLSPGRAWIALRTPEGDGSIALVQGDDAVRCEAWGPGADWLLDRAPGMLGDEAGPPDLEGPHQVVRDLARRFPGIRIPRTGIVMASLVPAVLEQKVTGGSARRAWFGLIRMHGSDAPGPAAPVGGRGLRLPPTDRVLAALPYYAYHPFGVERRRADLIRRVASRAPWFEAAAALPYEAASARLTSTPGLGPWTAAEVAVRAFGDPDAVSVGDFHLKNLVSWALAHEPRGTDERMLELLAPYDGRRAHVVRLLELGGPRPPKYGPRLTERRIESS